MIATRTTAHRRGFALPAVLWLTVGVATLTVGVSLVARETLASAHNRVALTRAAWMAEGCIERARAALDPALAADRVSELAWRRLDRVVLSSALTGGCDLALEPAGVALDVNVASGSMVRAVLRAARVASEQTDSLADALFDWHDDDDDARLHGAERAWYRAARRPLPRNGPLAAREELARVRGFDSVPTLHSLFGVEPGRVVVGRAPAPVLAALPGFGVEAIARAGEPDVMELPDLAHFMDRLSPAARAALGGSYAELLRSATLSPDAWIVTSRASNGSPRVAVVMEVRLVRAGPRAAVVRRRRWP
jgi:hypothetical protein